MQKKNSKWVVAETQVKQVGAKTNGKWVDDGTDVKCYVKKRTANGLVQKQTSNKLME